MSIPIADKYDIARGSSDIKLTPEGKQKIYQAGSQLAAMCGGSGEGRISSILTSDLNRTRESGRILQKCLGPMIPMKHDPSIDPWYQGWIEGKVVDPDILKEMQRLQVKNPNETPPGRGPLSTHPGESFNNYKDRFLRTMIPLMEHYKESLLTDSKDRVVVVNHYRGIKVLQSWISKGLPPDKSLDNEELLRHDGAPGDIHRMYIDSTGKWKIQDFDPPSWNGTLPHGIYVIRHGKTLWNADAGTEHK